MPNARRYIVILALCFSVILPGRAIEVTCGTMLKLRATAVEDWHFERWSDGNTDSVRVIEIISDTTLYAHFAPNCGDYAALPVISLYDWLLVLDVSSIQERGYLLKEDNVTWYRVKGIPDKIEEDTGRDDEQLSKGFYLTIDSSFVGTGDYYAVVDVGTDTSGILCTGLMRSELVHYTSSAPAPKKTPVLEPTYVRPYEAQRLLRLDPDQPTTVNLYDMSGHCLQTLTADGVERMSLQAAGSTGCYQVIVKNGKKRYVLRYIVKSD